MRAAIALLVGVGAVATFTVLRSQEIVGEASYVVLIVVSVLVAFGIYGFPRLLELDLKNLRLTLSAVKEATSEAKQAAQELEKVKREVALMYGGIDRLRREPLVLDDKKQKDLGLGGGIAMASATMRYPAGCIKRERERLARVFVNFDEKSPHELAQAILDNSMDDRVFKWNGPEVDLDTPPKPAEERKPGKESASSSD